LERAEQLARRKVVYEGIYPESKHGSAGGYAKAAKAASEIISPADESDAETQQSIPSIPKPVAPPMPPPSFAVDTARKTGMTHRTIQQDVQIANNLDSEVKETIRNTPIADNKSELLKFGTKGVKGNSNKSKGAF
jgi:hypothetical protein